MAGYNLQVQYEPELSPFASPQCTKLEVHSAFRGSKHMVRTLYRVKVQYVLHRYICNSVFTAYFVTFLRMYLHKYVRYAGRYNFTALLYGNLVLLKSPNTIVLAVSVHNGTKQHDRVFTVQPKVQQIVQK